jgi:Na+-translocating ferredoxin:NAD+ oxidoreductase RnfG subunit
MRLIRIDGTARDCIFDANDSQYQNLLEGADDRRNLRKTHEPPAAPQRGRLSAPAMQWRFAGPAALASIAVTVPAHATIYFTVEQVQQALFPGVTMTAMPVRLSDAQMNAIEKQAGVNVRNADQQVWRVAGGGFLIVDEVVGKHEFITYALALDAGGAVKGLEVMDYRESYGSEIRDAAWRAQFIGKTSAAPLKLDKDIRNISGATLSSRHIADGVKRLLAFYDAILKPLG